MYVEEILQISKYLKLQLTRAPFLALSFSSSNANTCLSISMPGNSSLDVSLKLSTGNGEETDHQHQGGERVESQLNWATGWATNQVASMGGPLAEALRSSTSNSSPTNILHQLPRSSTSEASFVST
ncbi:hypothetical protein Patl1_23496 [Pistacia atlantica]|uniref:Uncharacterized protein n=1 Tax=Pistacia atlantica TaxID=434234 RepID=A0ACC0ZXS2_9ROSI|nr:hypothetical protein Patl1_23496 [Pistacia atlantica]